MRRQFHQYDWKSQDWVEALDSGWKRCREGNSKKLVRELLTERFHEWLSIINMILIKDYHI